MVITILGGVGLFLLGMILMTDGLKSLAGTALRGLLARFVGGPTSAIVSGALVTAVVQSSSATTLTTIGFVSAGLLTFPQAVGVILGANLGTTSTGWLVSLVGLKVQVSVVALPAVLAGAILRLLGRDRIAAVGLVVAGFGLIFVGIGTLQTGMESLAQQVDLSRLWGDGSAHRLMLVGIGVAMTVIMQSSSAAVATTLTALHSGAIAFEGAAALVIGQNIGTTVTAAIASIGASVAARRTAWAHILFNVATAAAAFVALPLFTGLSLRIAAASGGDPGTVALAAFHTMFNLLGVLAFAPFLQRYANFIERLIPDSSPVLTRRLDSSVTTIAPVAVEAARLTLVDILRALASGLLLTLPKTLTAARNSQDTPRADADLLDRADYAMLELRRFIGQIGGQTESEAENRVRLSILHALDHLERLAEAMRSGERYRRDGAAVGDPTLHGVSKILAAEVQRVADSDPPSFDRDSLQQIQRSAETMAAVRRTHREEILRLTAMGELDPMTADARLDTMRWLDRLMYHLWRAINHLGVAAADGDGWENAGNKIGSPANQSPRLSINRATRAPLALLFAALCATSTAGSAYGQAATGAISAPHDSIMRADSSSAIITPQPLMAMAQGFAVNVAINRLDAVVIGHRWADVTTRTWSRNLRMGWEWDEDDFLGNMFAHPLHGALYFNAGRANDLDFWESAPLAFLGSWQWEYFGEVYRPSLNDFFMTSFGGIALGEVVHRMAINIRDNTSTGPERTVREIAAFTIDPMGSINRWIRGDFKRVLQNPEEHSPEAFVLRLSAGLRYADGGLDDPSEKLTPAVTTILDLTYGDPFIKPFSAPFDAFSVRFQLSPGGGDLNLARASGRLFGIDLNGADSRGRHVVGVNQRYDYLRNPAHRYGAQSVEAGIYSRWRLSSVSALRTQAFGSGIMLGAIDAPFGGSGNRTYDFGPGIGFRVQASYERRGITYATVEARTDYIHTVSGAEADHNLSMGGVELNLPIKSGFGIGLQSGYYNRFSRYSDLGEELRESPEIRLSLLWTAQARSSLVR